MDEEIRANLIVWAISCRPDARMQIITTTVGRSVSFHFAHTVDI